MMSDTMALLFVFIAVQLLFLCPSTNAAENESCIHNYAELERALRDSDTNNIPKLLSVFYHPNRQDSQVGQIRYCISENKTYCSTDEVFQFKWASSALLFIQEYELIDALVFDLFKFNYTHIPLIISPPFCEDVSEENKKDYLQLLTTRIKHLALSDDKNGLQDYAVYSNTTTNTIDIEKYYIRALQSSLLALQYVAIATIFITLLLRIWSNSFSNEIDIKLHRISKSFSLSRIIKLAKGRPEDINESNQTNGSETSKIKGWEYTVSYILLLVGFILWDTFQYFESKELHLKNWHLFFPIPCIAPTVIGVSTVISILWSGYILFKKCICCRNKSRNIDSTEVLASGSEGKRDSNPNSGNIQEDRNTTATTATKDDKTCTCRIRDIVHFPILTGLGVFFVIHGIWMLLMLSTYATIVIVRSLFILPLFCFVMVLLPRLIKALCNCCIDSHCKKKNCKMCTCDQCQRCIHCKECTLCNDCKNCKKCTQCCSCKLSNCFKLCIDCMNERKERNAKDFTTIYGFFVIVANAIPLLLVLHYGSNYILVVTDLNENLVTLLIALAVIVGVPYYLILLWDSGNDNNDGKAN